MPCSCNTDWLLLNFVFWGLPTVVYSYKSNLLFEWCFFSCVLHEKCGYVLSCTIFTWGCQNLKKRDKIIKFEPKLCSLQPIAVSQTDFLWSLWFLRTSVQLGLLSRALYSILLCRFKTYSHSNVFSSAFNNGSLLDIKKFQSNLHFLSTLPDL